jgi:hypothetical protein
MASSRKFHVSPYKPVRIRPSGGGKLMSAESSDSVGIFNYTVKRDWRRVRDREVRAEGQEWFWANVTIPMGQQPYPNYPNTQEPITLLVEAIQPNGKRAIVAGTPTTLYRYFALDNGAYYAGNGTPDAYYDETVTDPGVPYYDDNPGVWIEIGSGFSPLAQRWEWEQIAGWLCLNNGVDLPVTYEVQDYAVEPIYELRESGIASVGNISQYAGMMLVADISVLTDAKLLEILSPVSAGTVNEAQAGTVSGAANVLTAAGSTPFLSGMVGWQVSIGSGQSAQTRTITGFTSTTAVTVDGDASIFGPLPFALLQPITASQAGSIQPNNNMATLAANVVTATGAPFLAGMVGWTITFANGQSRNITGFTDTSTITVDGDATGLGPLQFFLIQPGTADYTLLASANIFDPTMVGRQIIFPDGTTRIIVSYNSAASVVVDVNQPIAASAFAFNNPEAYAPFTDATYFDRIQYRLMNSMEALPRRWGAVAPASITAGGISLVFQYPVKSFAAGQLLEILGAGVNGGNLTATLLYLAPDGMHGIIDTQAATTVVNSGVEQSDAIGSLVGFVDLQDDGSGIIAMMDLQGYLIVYKDTSIFFGQFTGVAGAAIDFSQSPAYHGDKTLYYRNTLIEVNAKGQVFHFYAGRNSFYKLDIVLRVPVEVEQGEACKNLFFDNVDIPGTLGVELVAAGQVYPDSEEVLIPTTAGGSYYYLGGDNELGLFNGNELVGTGQFIATGSTVSIEGFVPGSAVTASLQALNNIGVFSAENPITKEIFVCFPTSQSPDKAIRFDYFTGEVSTTSAAYTAAAAVKRPVAGIQVGPSEDWFIMADASGTVSRYGLTNTRPFVNVGSVTQSDGAGNPGNLITADGGEELFTPDLVIGRSIQFPDLTVVNVTGFVGPTQITVGGPAVTRASTVISIISASWHRLGQPYDSVLQTGLECFGSSFSEKTIESWLLLLASPSPQSAIEFELLGAVNPTDTPPTIAQTTLLPPFPPNLVGLLHVANYFGVRMTISGMNNPEQLIEQVMNIAAIDDKGFVQR